MHGDSILIVDDEIIIARELEARLRSLGYRVTGIASSGAEAIHMATATPPGLVLMDIVLKGDLDGIEAATEIRRRVDTPVIYVTAYTDRRTLDRARVTEPFGYIVKPFSERELHANIEMALYKHRAETRLRQIERWFATAVGSVADAVIGADLPGTITVFNPAAEEITGWRHGGAIGRPLGEVVRLVGRDGEAGVRLEDVLQGPLVRFGTDTVLVDYAQRRIPVDSTTCCVRDGEGNPAGTVTVLRDVSGLRPGALSALTADVALAAAESMSLRGMLQMGAESMVRNLGAALARIWTMNTAGDTLVLEASAGLYTELDGEQSQVPVEELHLGSVARSRVPFLTNDAPNDRRVTHSAFIQREGLRALAAYPLINKGSLVGVMAVFSRHTLSAGVVEALEAVAQAIAVGVTQRRLEEQLRHSQKLEAVGRLAGGVAHDFNNVLTVIGGSSSLLLAAETLDAESRVLVEEIARAGERAAKLTRQLLAVSRRQVLEPRQMDLNASVREMESMLRALLGEDVSLSSALAPGLWPVLADPGQVEQILMNLAVNARDAMPQGGQLTLETANRELEESVAAPLGMQAGRYAMLSVSDTGCGMTAEVRAHLFEPFFTTKGSEGTGLGLATVQGIVEQSGGHVSVYSEPGMGTTFKVYLPVAVRAAGRADPAPVVTAPRGTETVLLVEDEPALRKLFRMVLEGYGYTVLPAGDGYEGLKLGREHPGPIHLLLTDVVLPGMGGRALAEEVANHRPGLRVLYMSGYTDDAVIRHGVLEAETAFLQKPFSPPALAAKVRQVLDAPSA